MKKLLLIAALIFASYGAFADDFDDAIGYIKNELASNSFASIRGAKNYNIVFIDYKLDGRKDLSTVNIEEAKKVLLSHWKQDQRFVAVVKQAAVVILVNYINEDRNVFTIIITPDDL